MNIEGRNLILSRSTPLADANLTPVKISSRGSLSKTTITQSSKFGPMGTR